ncbi:MAG: hypothetical protein QM644_08005 [Mobilitalea sp.]
MTDFDKKWLGIFIGAEVITFLFSKLILALLGLIPVTANVTVNEGLGILKGLIIPVLLIITALVIMGVFKNNRDGGGTL